MAGRGVAAVAGDAGRGVGEAAAEAVGPVGLAEERAREREQRDVRFVQDALHCGAAPETADEDHGHVDLAGEARGEGQEVGFSAARAHARDGGAVAAGLDRVDAGAGEQARDFERLGRLDAA